jgi:hypothetical protein
MGGQAEVAISAEDAESQAGRLPEMGTRPTSKRAA